MTKLSNFATPRGGFLFLISLISIYGSGCGGGQQGMSANGMQEGPQEATGAVSVLPNKSGKPTNLNTDAPKNAQKYSVTGTRLNLADGDRASAFCQGRPPAPPEVPAAITVSSIPSTLIPVTQNDIKNTPEFSLNEFGDVCAAVKRVHSKINQRSVLGQRLLLNTIQLSFGKSGTRPLPPPVPPEHGSPGSRSVKGQRNSHANPILNWLDEFNKLADAEKLVVFKYPVEAYNARNSAGEAYSTMRDVYPNEGENETKADAFRHAYWNILMCSRASFEFAQAMANAHETRENTVQQHNMDFHNNSVGQAIFYLNRPSAGDEKALLAALFNYIEAHPFQWDACDSRPNTASLVYINPPPPPPAPRDIVVRETDLTSNANQVGFYRGGTSRYWWTSRSHGQDGQMYWTYSNGSTRDNYGVWRPNLPQSRNYEVFVYIPSYYASTKSGIYEIHHANGITKRIIRQWDFFNEWVSLGVYSFPIGSEGYILLGDNTSEPLMQRWVGFDSIKWVAK